jgi:hypothetical protein
MSDIEWLRMELRDNRKDFENKTYNRKSCIRNIFSIILGSILFFIFNWIYYDSSSFSLVAVSFFCGIFVMILFNEFNELVRINAGISLLRELIISYTESMIYLENNKENVDIKINHFKNQSNNLELK